MLESLHLKNVGPAPKMEMQLAPRLNLITGDNGLGKSFLLDVKLEPNQPVRVAFMLTDEDARAVRVVVQDPATDAELYRSPGDIPVKLGV